MQRSTFCQIAATARDALRVTPARPGQLILEDSKRAVVEAAAPYALAAKQLETAIRSFAETQDPKDRGIAAYIDGQYSQVEQLLKGPAEKKESDLVETLRYLDAAQYEQAKYRAATDTFRKALAVHGEDAVVLSWLGKSLTEPPEWSESELLLHRALAIPREELWAGPQAANRFAEAEPLMRRRWSLSSNSHAALGTNTDDARRVPGELPGVAQKDGQVRRGDRSDNRNAGPFLRNGVACRRST